MSRLLAFDVGNTSVKCVLVEGDTQIMQGRLATRPGRSWEAYREELAQMMPDADDLGAGVVASVVRGMAKRLSRAVEDLWGVSLKEIDASLNLGIGVGVPHPDRVGIDRLLACAAAYRLVEGAAVVAGVGSALTVDLVSEAGEYLGGTISPGLGMALRALPAGTSLLPEVDLETPSGVLGKTTSDCIRSGVVYGMAGAVDRLYEELNAATEGDSQLVLTGGDAVFLAPYLKTACEVESDLVLRGMVWTYDQNFGPG